VQPGAKAIPHITALKELNNLSLLSPLRALNQRDSYTPGCTGGYSYIATPWLKTRNNLKLSQNTLSLLICELLVVVIPCGCEESPAILNISIPKLLTVKEHDDRRLLSLCSV